MREIPDHKFQIPSKLQIPIQNIKISPHPIPLPSGERGRVRGINLFQEV